MSPSSKKRKKHEDDANDIVRKCDQFFADTPEPSNVDAIRQSLDDFFSKHHEHLRNGNKKITFITSGGTSAPLEKPPMAVRFLDNFSSGARGAALCEYLSKEGYCVVSLRRTGSKLPFVRKCEKLFTKKEKSVHNEHVDFLSMFSNNNNKETKDGEENDGLISKLKFIQADRERAYTEHGFLEIEFTTVYEYLHLLRLVSEKVNAYANDVMIIHAAAVSDFYIPWSELASHKIQSNALETSGNLFANFSSTPKMLKMCRDVWAPNAFCVSFKLETDASIIKQKTLSAMEKYNMHCIVANELDKRYDEVTIFQKEELQVVGGGGEEEEEEEEEEERKKTGGRVDAFSLLRDPSEEDIEKQLVDELKRRHEEYASKRVSS